jgi:hypothetical protein
LFCYIFTNIQLFFINFSVSHGELQVPTQMAPIQIQLRIAYQPNETTTTVQPLIHPQPQIQNQIQVQIQDQNHIQYPIQTIQIDIQNQNQNENKTIPDTNPIIEHKINVIQVEVDREAKHRAESEELWNEQFKEGWEDTWKPPVSSSPSFDIRLVFFFMFSFI